MSLSTKQTKKIISSIFEYHSVDLQQLTEEQEYAMEGAVSTAYDRGYEDGEDSVADKSPKMAKLQKELEKVEKERDDLQEQIEASVNIGGDYVDSFDASVESQKTEILRDLFRNCTVKELEALELLIRNKKPEYNFSAGRAVPHPDNIYAGVLLPLSTPLFAGFAIVKGYSTPVAVEEEIGDAVHGAFVRI